MPKLIDTHAHVQFNAFKGETDDILRRTVAGDVWVNLIGTQKTTSKKAIEAAERLGNGVFATIGLHPSHLTAMEFDEDEMPVRTRSEKFDLDVYTPLASHKKVVAIGECGLDWYRLPKDMAVSDVKKLQEDSFITQLDFADLHDLPIVIHCREGITDETQGAYARIAEILEQQFSEGKNPRKGVVHSYTGGADDVKKFLDLGMMISLSGISTFPARKSSKDATLEHQKAVQLIPLDRLLVETDSPYLSPQPHRGKRNEPLYVEHVVRHLASVRGVGFDEFAQVTTENALRTFPKMN